MGKKSRRNNHKKNKKENVQNLEEKDSDLQEEAGQKRCPHLSKAVKLGVLQNHVPHIKLRQCSHCNCSNSEDAGVCICLRCANQGCDRYSNDKHALSHHNQCPSHNVTLHLQSMIAWCYGCDMELPLIPDSDLHECVKLLIKALKLDPPNDQKLTIPKIGTSIHRGKQLVNNIVSAHDNSQKIKGLVNLGNTCFFNAVMQNLNQTELLHIAISFVNQSEYSQRIVGPKNKLTVQVTNPAGSLLVSLNKLLGDFRSAAPGPLNPKFLFSEICKKAPRFKGFQQQDSQELLRYLLDSVKTDQMKRIKVGVLKHFEVTEGVDIKSLPADKKEKIKEYVHLVTAPCIDSIFAGKLDSIVVCHQCHKESRVTESFLDLSLSLVKPQEHKIKPLSSKVNPVLARQKKNCVDQNNEVKPQPLSKHQQKVAKEAKRKKGRKKGKQRTNSRSSEDGLNEVGHLSNENNNTIDTASGLEGQHDNDMDDDLNDSDFKHEDNNISSPSEDNMQSEEKTALASEFDERREFSSPQEDENAINSTENRRNQKNITPDPVLKLSHTVDSSSRIEINASLHKSISNSLENHGSDLNKAHNFLSYQDNCHFPERTSKHVASKRNDSDSEKKPEETTKLTNVNNTLMKNSSDREAKSDLIQAAVVCPNHEEIRSPMETGSSISDTSPEEDDVLRNIKGEGTINSVLEKEIDEFNEERAFEKKRMDNNAIERKHFYNSVLQGTIDCDKSHDIVMQDEDESQSFGLEEKVGKEMITSGAEKQDQELCFREDKNIISDQETAASSGMKKCTVASFEEACKSLYSEKEVTILGNENASPDSSNVFQNEVTLNEEINAPEGVVNNTKFLNTSGDSAGISPTKNCCFTQNSEERDLEHEPTDIETTSNSPQNSKLIRSERTLENKSLCVSKLENFDKSNLKKPSLGVVSYVTETIQHSEDEIETFNELPESSQDKIIETKSLNNQQHNVPGANVSSEGLYTENTTTALSEFAKFSLPRINSSPLQNTVEMEMCNGNNGDTTNSPKVFTIGSPYTPSPGECSLQSCLAQFCSPEILQGKNKFLCEVCSKEQDFQDGNSSSDESFKGAKAPKTVYTEATKQLLISSPPPVLTLHLKRFQQVGHGLKKVPKHVEFPFVLDLAPFCCSGTKTTFDSSDAVLYSLIGLVEHSGGLNSGHYTACIKLKHTPTYNGDLTNIKDLGSFIQELWTKDGITEYTHQNPMDGQWYYVSDSRVTMVTEEKVKRSQAYMLFYERLPLKRTSR